MQEAERTVYSETPLSGSALFLVALALTGLGTLLAFFVSGGPPPIGIDDAAITRNYAENLSNGHGFVYYIGGERVEGSTSLLWTLIVALAYAIAPEPELLILGIGFVLSVFSTYAVLSLGSLLSHSFDLPQREVTGAIGIGLLGLPGFYFWSVFTMMELALWSAVLLTLTWRLARLVERPKPWSFGVIALAPLLPLIRPEGIAVALGLMILAALLMARFPRGLKLAVLLVLISFAAVTTFRLVYFGYPVPNTFYAKVSSDRLQDLIDGAKYFFSFVGEFPFAETLLLFWGLVSIWAIGRLISPQSEGARGLLIATAAIAGIFMVYSALGGDHFAYWRFFQPVTPLLPIVPAIALVALWNVLARADLARLWVRSCAALLVSGLWLGISYGEYRQARFDLIKEFTLVEEGLAFGKLMNSFDNRPTLGIGPAGGISLSYDGPILDLLGLNWVEMAHANPVKTGLRNHASFDAATFWKNQPDLIAEFNRPCSTDGFVVHRADQGLVKGLYLESEFQGAYAPVRIIDVDADRCWRGFARRDWLKDQPDERIEIVDWDEVTLILSSAEPPQIPYQQVFESHRTKTKDHG